MNFRRFLMFAGMFLLPLTAVIVPLLIGQSYGIYHSMSKVEVHHASLESVVSAAFGLLAFMLGFTFQIAANRYDSRRTLLLAEVQGIRTAYLRAGLIPEPYRFKTRKHLIEYIQIRLDLAADQSKLKAALIRSQALLDSLWSYIEALAETHHSSEIFALFTTAITDMVHLYNQRITMALVYRIPKPVKVVLFILVILSMLVLGYQFGLSGKGSFKIMFLLAFIFSIVMFLIAVLDRPETGLLRLNQEPLMKLQQEVQRKILIEKT